MELLEDFFGELARVAFAFLGERHQCIALVIAEFGISGRANLDQRKIGVGQDGGDGGLDALF